MRNHTNYRPRRPRQASPFLNLPGEIRNQIYQLALTSAQPIDLWTPTQRWPPQHSESLDPILQYRFSKLPKAIPGQTRPLFGLPNPPRLGYRLQNGLRHVRKDLSTGLLCTCLQIYTEAADYFWRDNTWRFSADEDWEGVYRFLLTIGPCARSRIHCLDILAPVTLLPNSVGFLDGRIKNEPKMRMAKLWHKNWWTVRNCYDLVFTLLEEEKTLHCLNLLVPAYFQISNFSEWVYRDIGRVPNNFPLEVRVVIEAGARIDETSLESIDSKGWGTVCLAGSEIFTSMPDGSPLSRKIAAGECEMRASKYDYLNGLPLLFEEGNQLSTHANGGRVPVSRPLTNVKLSRALETFGPCMITTHHRSCTCSVWSCRRTKKCTEIYYKSLVDVDDDE